MLDNNYNADNQYANTVPEDLQIPDRTEKDEATDDQMSFVRKVLGIVAGQLVLTSGTILLSAYSESFGDFCQSLPC